ncbi:MAG: glycosyltransferase [Geminicoccaceae bacterium]
MVDVFFWVQHLLGIGHLARAATLVRAMRRHGLEVTLASGGLPVPALDLAGGELLQLEPVQCRAGDFSTLLNAAGEPVDEAFRQRRAGALVASFAARRPRLLLLEMFPFGRRQMRFELEPLLDAARALAPRPPIVSSVRDILVQKKKPGREAEMLARALTFDLVLAHGDPAFVPFSATFPASAELGDRLIETGYVMDPVPADDGGTTDGQGEIIVSAGGGRVGEHLLETAIAASALARGGPAWRVLVGWQVPEADFAAIARRARPGLVIERARRDFRTLLGRCALSVSQGGYNTVVEVLAAGCRAVVVPYAEDGETEQTLRSNLLAGRGLLYPLAAQELDPSRLAGLVAEVLARPAPPGPPPRMDGAEVTARLLRRLTGPMDR